RMSLRTKFAILIGALAMAVTLTLALAGWSVVFLERELSAPLEDTERVMTRLAQIKRAVGAQHNLLAPEAVEAAIGPSGRREPRAPEGLRADFGMDRHAALAGLEELQALGPRVRGAVRAARSNLAARLDDAYRAAEMWLEARDEHEPA